MKHAWHFVDETLRDGRPLPKDGEWLEHDGTLLMCNSGLHASKRLIDTLKYAPGSTLCRVAMDGNILEDSDKMVASRRKILWRIDAEALLSAFARWCAIQVVDKWEAPPVVLSFLRTGKGRNAADSAARSFRRNAADSAAWSAANSAARSAARSAACGAARGAADSAADSAARSAAWGAARGAQNVILGEFVREARSGYTEWELTF